MFTGLVEDRGEIVAFRRTAGCPQLTIRAPLISWQASPGESIAVNGCCLTATAGSKENLTFDLLEETIARTNLSTMDAGAPVNLERALAAQGRVGGHFVQGHIDCTSVIISFEKEANDHRLEIGLPGKFARYIAFKGSVAVDGISLTVGEVGAASFVTWIIPHTLAVTNLSSRKKGDRVNLEFDLLAKYVERIVQLGSGR